MVFEFPFSKTNLPKQLFINNEVTKKTKTPTNRTSGKNRANE